MLFETKEDLSRLLVALPAAATEARAAAAHRQTQLTKPAGSLGRLEDIAVFLAGWQRDGVPAAERIQVLVFAGNHGVTRQAVSPFPSEVTVQMVANFRSGGAAINALAHAFGLDLAVHALDLEHPTRDISTEPAMTEAETLEALNAGAAAIDSRADIVIFGEMGIGNTTIAAALCAACLGGSGAAWAGPGTGLDAPGVAHKALVIDRALTRHGNTEMSAFDCLRSLGGRELCAIAGGVAAARLQRIPVVLDGFVVSAALAPLFKEAPDILAHCLAGHCSAEPAHRHLLERFGLAPLLTLSMRLGEGTGAALASQVIRGAVATHTRMATFAEAGLSDRGA